MYRAQGHNTVMPVRLKLGALRSRVKHSTTEPLHSHCSQLKIFFFNKLLFRYTLGKVGDILSVLRHSVGHDLGPNGLQRLMSNLIKHKSLLAGKS